MAIKLNPDKSVVDAIRNRLKVTEGQCPCVAQYLWTEDTKCPCKAFREDKYCCCNLYVEVPDEDEKPEVPNATEWMLEAIKKIIIEAEKVGLTHQDLQDAVDKIILNFQEENNDK